MSRRKQSNPQHVHDQPGPVASLSDILSQSSEVQAEAEPSMKKSGSLSDTGELQSDSGIESLPQANCPSDPCSFASNTDDISSRSPLGENKNLPGDQRSFSGVSSTEFSRSGQTPTESVQMSTISSEVTFSNTTEYENMEKDEVISNSFQDRADESDDSDYDEGNGESQCHRDQDQQVDFAMQGSILDSDKHEANNSYDEESGMGNVPSGETFTVTSLPHDVIDLGRSSEISNGCGLPLQKKEEEANQDFAISENNPDLDYADEDPCNAEPDEDVAMETSPDDEKENLNTERMVEMINKARPFFNEAKASDDSLEESKELDEIKDQVRMLQQQQMYQVQMLNYLHFQLTVMASNPQTPRSQPGVYQPGALNGLQLQNMPHLLAAAASMSGSGGQAAPPAAGSLFPSMAAAIGRQLSSSKATEEQQHRQDSNANENERQGDLSTTNTEKAEKMQHHMGRVNLNEQYNPLSSLALLQRSPSNVPNKANGLYGKVSNGVSDPEPEGAYMKHACRFCQKVFGSDSALQIHLRSHTGERPFKCNICASRFSTKGNLKVHFVRHNDKYPHIEMNANPVPEYLDNVPTTSGIPYGMSIIPDPLDNKPAPHEVSTVNQNTSAAGKPSVELPAPYQTVDSNSFDLLRGDKDTAQPNDSEDVRSNDSLDSEERHSINEANSKQERNYDHSGDEKVPPFPSSVLSMLPFSKPAIAGATPGGMSPFIARMTSSLSSISSDKDPRKSTSELGHDANSFSGSDHEGGVPKHAASSSETSKLQRLVEQIDRGKELEKNECHICHRVLSCQSALKLHYRTHTGERPYKCDLCARAFTTRGNLRTHYSSVHRQQLRNSPPEGAASARGNALQCPLCGSRFMDQQSIHQHMQMHLYMHSQQQQQQAAQMMNGHVPQVDYRMLGMMSGGFQPGSLGSSAVTDRVPHNNEAKPETDEAAMDNDDVFEESLSERNESPKMSDDGSRDWESPALKSPAVDYASDRKYMKTPPATGNLLHLSQGISDTANRSDCSNGDEVAAHVTRIDPSALDLTRPASHSSSVDNKDSSPRIITSRSPSPKSVTSSLSALAHLASNSSIMRPNGMSMMSLQMSPNREEIRSRKMTTACDICSKPFTCQSALEIHLRSHTKERPFLCRVCERGFTTKGNLKQHLLTHNITDVDDDMLEPVSSPMTGNSNSCSPINSPLHNGTPSMKRPLDASQSGPVAKRNYPRHWCHICQKQFSSASSLQIHNRTHTGEKPFACSVCGRAFTTKGNLKVHMGTHVWGAGGSRRGRRISMDNPLISPWMQNTSSTNTVNPPLRPRVPPQIPAVPDPAALYQQYAALASGLMGAKAATDARFHGSAMLNFNNAAAARLLMPNNHVTTSSAAPTNEQSVVSTLKDNNNKSMAAAATEWIWKAYQRTQEQVN